MSSRILNCDLPSADASKPDFSSLLDAVDLMETRRISAPIDSDSRPAYRWNDVRRSILCEQAVEPGVLPGKVTRKRLGADSVKILTDLFDSGVHFPTRDQREHLSTHLHLPSRTVQIWFQNRRQAFKNKRQSMMMDEDEEDRRSSSSISMDENLPVLMTKLKFDKRVSQLVESRTALKVPAYINTSYSGGLFPKSPKRRRSEPIATIRMNPRKMSIEQLTRIETILPHPPALKMFSPLMMSLSTKLPQISGQSTASLEHSSDAARLPSIGHALRRFSII